MSPPEFTIALGRLSEYSRAKRLLDRGHHPIYIGRGQFDGYAKHGGCLFVVVAGEDAGVAIVSPRLSVLIALNVLPDWRARGLGGAVLSYLTPNWARVLEDAVPWFTARGYRSVGALKQGRRYRTQVMVRSDLIGLAGRLSASLDAAEADRVEALHTGVQAVKDVEQVGGAREPVGLGDPVVDVVKRDRLDRVDPQPCPRRAAVGAGGLRLLADADACRDLRAQRLRLGSVDDLVAVEVLESEDRHNPSLAR